MVRLCANAWRAVPVRGSRRRKNAPTSDARACALPRCAGFPSPSPPPSPPSICFLRFVRSHRHHDARALARSPLCAGFPSPSPLPPPSIRVSAVLRRLRCARVNGLFDGHRHVRSPCVMDGWVNARDVAARSGGGADHHEGTGERRRARVALVTSGVVGECVRRCLSPGQGAGGQTEKRRRAGVTMTTSVASRVANDVQTWGLSAAWACRCRRAGPSGRRRSSSRCSRGCRCSAPRGRSRFRGRARRRARTVCRGRCIRSDGCKTGGGGGVVVGGVKELGNLGREVVEAGAAGAAAPGSAWRNAGRHWRRSDRHPGAPRRGDAEMPCTMPASAAR